MDPGGSFTGLAVVNVDEYDPKIRVEAWATIQRRKGVPVLPVERDYLIDVTAWIADAVRHFDPSLVAVEGVVKPRWYFDGKAKPIDPTPLLATAVVVGAVLARLWPVKVVEVAPGQHSAMPTSGYPEDLRPTTRAAGKDKHRHVRSAIDVAICARSAARFAARKRAVTL